VGLFDHPKGGDEEHRSWRSRWFHRYIDHELEQIKDADRQGLKFGARGNGHPKGRHERRYRKQTRWLMFHPFKKWRPPGDDD